MFAVPRDSFNSTFLFAWARRAAWNLIFDDSGWVGLFLFAWARRAAWNPSPQEGGSDKPCCGQSTHLTLEASPEVPLGVVADAYALVNAMHT